MNLVYKSKKAWGIFCLCVLVSVIVLILIEQGVIFTEKVPFTKLTNYNIEKIAKQENIIIYYANERCQTCRKLSKVFFPLVKGTKMNIYYIDSEHNKLKKYLRKYNLYATPTILVISKGEIVKRWESEDTFDGIEEIYDEYYRKR
ncbi:thioredoxin family protein [Candidatus Ruminimicrobium bovinum]|uniref:thioredoxin family protein n=1 Tax=Candidatus Ruminimicrobium bovinum TaxID=3242779 RepID=UPI0039B8E5AC